MKTYEVKRIERTYLGTFHNRQEEKRRKKEECATAAALDTKIKAGVSLFERKRRIEQQQIEIEVNGCVITKSDEGDDCQNYGGNVLELQWKGSEMELNEAELMENIRGYGWRKLPASSIGASFFHANKHKIEKCSGRFFNQCNKSRIIGMVDPVSLYSLHIEGLSCGVQLPAISNMLGLTLIVSSSLACRSSAYVMPLFYRQRTLTTKLKTRNFYVHSKVCLSMMSRKIGIGSCWHKNFAKITTRCC